MIIIHGTSQKTNGLQFSSGPQKQCLRFRFWYREKPKTRTLRTLPNSLRKNVNKYVSIIIIHRPSRKTNGVQFSSGPRNQCPRFRFWYREKPKMRTSRTCLKFSEFFGLAGSGTLPHSHPPGCRKGAALLYTY